MFSSVACAGRQRRQELAEGTDVKPVIIELPVQAIKSGSVVNMRWNRSKKASLHTTLTLPDSVACNDGDACIGSSAF